MKRLLVIAALSVICSPVWSQTTWVQRSGPTSLTRWSYATTQNGKIVLQSETQDKFSLVLIKPSFSAYKFRACERECKIETVIGSHRQFLLADPYDEKDQFITVELNRNQQDEIKALEARDGQLVVKMPYQASMSNEIKVNLGNARIGEAPSQKGSPIEAKN